MKRTVLISMFLVLGVSALGFSQTKAAYFNEPAEIVLPRTYSSSKAYPLLLMLPYTTGTAEEFYNRYSAEIDSKRCIILLTKGRPTRSDYLPDFIKYVDWYEDRIMADIRRTKRLYNIDEECIVLAGFSLGGDLSWALTMKQPDLFSGAIIAGTRCSYPPDQNDMEVLKHNKYKAAFFIGEDEDINRYDGINAARWTLENRGIETRYVEVPGKHVPPPKDRFIEALDWILTKDTQDTGKKKVTQPNIDEGPPDTGIIEEKGKEACILRLVNNSSRVINSIDVRQDTFNRTTPLMGTYRGDEPLRPGEEMSFKIFSGDVIMIKGEGGFTAETPKVQQDVLMILKANGTVKIYK